MSRALRPEVARTRTHGRRARVRSWGSLLVVTVALACSADGGSEGEQPAFTPFGGSGGGGPASGNAGAGGNPAATAGVQGIPEQNGALPLAPDGNSVPANNGVTGQPPEPEPPVLENVLVFTRTLSYRHDSIAVGVEAIRTLGSQNGFAVQQTEDPALFNDDGLADFDVVVWLSTTADVLDETQQAAFQRYIRAGGGWVGVHAAADTEYDWAWYGQLLGGGAYFASHPEIQPARLNVEAAEHASAAHLPPDFELTDEWYNFQANPRSAATVVMTLDESSYAPGADAMGADHPIAWYHEFEGGRAWYTALGHRSELYTDPLFTQHLLGGIRWAASVAP